MRVSFRAACVAVGAFYGVVALLGVYMIREARAQEVNRIFHVEPGMVLTVTKDSGVVYQRTLSPGDVQVVIRYIKRNTIKRKDKPK